MSRPRGAFLNRSATGDRYRWIALSNTTLAVFMSALDGSIVIIALPAIFAASSSIRWRPAVLRFCCG